MNSATDVARMLQVVPGLSGAVGHAVMNLGAGENYRPPQVGSRRVQPNLST